MALTQSILHGGLRSAWDRKAGFFQKKYTNTQNQFFELFVPRCLSNLCRTACRDAYRDFSSTKLPCYYASRCPTNHALSFQQDLKTFLPYGQ